MGTNADVKNDDKDEKNWENELENEFWIIQIKIGLQGNSYENLRQKVFDSFFKTFLTDRGKNKNENEKLLKIEFGFWFSTWKFVWQFS